MANTNLGPAVTSNASATAVLAPAQTPNYGNLYQGLNAIRLLCVARGVNLAVTGDTVMPIINALSYSVANIVVTNSQLAGVGGSIATASIGVFTAAAGGGTAIKAQAALASNTSQTAVVQATVASTALILPNAAPYLYLNCGTALATASCDVFVYGYDLT
jgi:hypothetical protein